jgi:1,4-alpha-glucan branching enzyme
MSITIAPEQIDRIVCNQHRDPFEVLGPHRVERGDRKVWAVRAYLPDADAVWVILPEERTEYPMEATHHPHFFECTIDSPSSASDSFPSSYQLRIRKGEHDRVVYDPYAFRSSKLTDIDIHLFGEGNHHRIYEKLGAHLMELDGVKGVYFAVWAPTKWLNAAMAFGNSSFPNWASEILISMKSRTKTVISTKNPIPMDTSRKSDPKRRRSLQTSIAILGTTPNGWNSDAIAIP